MLVQYKSLTVAYIHLYANLSIFFISVVYLTLKMYYEVCH